tara:strand:+ start:42 stop:467 length:426 start_codon:yes stop_codon:yes gene_type:complete
MDKKNHIIKNKKYYDYDRNMNLRYFNIEEFNSKDKKNSGMNMDKGFLTKLDYARHNAQCSFVITSGYRTPFQNRLVNGVEDSSHTKIPCSACDISTPDSNTRFKILKSLLDIGFTRIGIGKGFIHVDDDPDKSTEVLWHYY